MLPSHVFVQILMLCSKKVPEADASLFFFCHPWALCFAHFNPAHHQISISTNEQEEKDFTTLSSNGMAQNIMLITPLSSVFSCE
jgi:hypothetical protein